MKTSLSPRLMVVSLRAQDLPACFHFYRDVIGLVPEPHHGHYPTFDLGNDALLVILPGVPRQDRDSQEARFPVIAFAVENLEIAVEHLQAHGVAIPWGVESSPEARWVMFYDPAGNLIELAQAK